VRVAEAGRTAGTGNMERDEAARAAIEHIRRHLVAPLALALRDVTPAAVWTWRHRVLVLRHFVRHALDGTVQQQVEALLATSGSLWRLLSEHAEALAEIQDYKSARGISAWSDAVAIGEELLSGEDVGLRDYVMEALSFLLNWQSNTYWVDAGHKAHRAVARSYLLEIQDELWEFLHLSSGVTLGQATMEQAEGIGSRADALIHVLAKASLPTNAQVALLAFLYQWMLRLRTGKLLMALEEVASPAT
jgi:hypothetical protein